MRGSRAQRSSWATAGLLAVLAFVPALTSAPGRMPADSKLYLYLDPGRFLGDAATTFDPRQFAGWVPHQHIAYLWPAGPWFWVFDTLGVPDWIAHRLWIGTLLLAAGLGVRWVARLLGLGPMAAAVAALAYQLSPYVLPYVSRTSVMLLPWAGLGWIVGFTIRATRRSPDAGRLTRWADPAAIALVVLTVGAVNATALAMIVPGPLLWLVHATWLGEVRWPRALAIAARASVLSIGVSLWWAVMLTIQGRHGAEILPYSESLADVSVTATSSEVWRQLGYWLFYIRDRSGATTTESLRYLSSSLAITISYAVPIGALAALAFTRWRERRFAALLIGAGLVLAVGVHPIGARSPLMRVLTGDADDGLALALRSSTRALPVAVLGLALALAAGVAALDGRRVRGIDIGRLAGGLVTMLVLANLPALWTGGFVDPALERDQDPPEAWVAAADSLDDPDGRVLQVPGLEFGAFRWGFTVDQPLAGLSDQALVTRDLLPLGSAGAMDLLYALDDRIQDGTLEPEAVATIAGLLGATDIWLTNDAAYDRYDVTAPGVVGDWLDAAPGLDAPVAYGAATANAPVLELDDARYLGSGVTSTAAAPVEIYPVEDADGVARAASGTLVVSGSGDGLVDAAAAGLLPDGRAIVYSAATDDLAAALGSSGGLLVTDSNRARARQWRSSQDATGFTESAGRDGAAPTALTEPAVGDSRLPVFADTSAGVAGVDPDTQTTAEQRGPVVATASGYGQPFALLPEHRPYMAVDGDASTAWTVGEHADPIGATLDLTLTDPTRLPDELAYAQFAEFPDQRQIDRFTIDAYDAGGRQVGTQQVVEAGAEGRVPLDLPAGTARLRITVDSVAGGRAFTEGIVAAVGFTTLDLGLGPTVEVVRVPTDATDVVGPGTPVAYEFSRLRADPADRWRDDPEPTLVREFDVPDSRALQLSDTTVRLDQRASDAELGTLLGWPATASSRLLGNPEHAGVAAVDGDPATAWITGFDEARGATLSIGSVSQPVTSIGVRQAPGTYSPVTTIELTGGDGTTRTIELAPGADGVARAAVDPPLPAGPLTITLADVDPVTTVDRRFGDQFELPAAIAEIELAGLPQLPDYTQPQALTGCIPLATLDDTSLTFQLTTSDSAVDPTWLGSPELVALPCRDTGDRTVDLTGGTHLLTGADTGLPVDLDRIVLGSPPQGAPTPTVEVLHRSARERTLQVTGCAEGCWVILGEGYNDAWSAEVAGRGELGAPTMLDGGFTGWWVGPGDDAVTVHARWTAQRALTVAYAVSAGFALACTALLVGAWRRGAPLLPATAAPALARRARPAGPAAILVTAAAWIGVSGLLCGPWGLLWGALGAAATVLLGNRRVPALTALATVVVLGAAVTLREHRIGPPPDGGWPAVFERYHGLGMYAVAALIVAALTADDAGSSKPELDRPASVGSRT